MRKLVTTTLFIGAISALLPACGAPDILLEDDAGAADSLVEDGKADSLGGSYYWLRRDTRRCLAPACGGYFVSRVNRGTTLCGDGTYAESCYVASVDFGGRSRTNAALVRGSLAASSVPHGAVLKASEVYAEVGGPADPDGLPAPAETFYRLRDKQIACTATGPCPRFQREKLNSSYTSLFDLVDWSAIPSYESALYLAMAEGNVIATGSVRYRGASLGRSFSASRAFVLSPIEGIACSPEGKSGGCPVIHCKEGFPCVQYVCLDGRCQLPAAPTPVEPPTQPRSCMRTGCSGTTCSDEVVFSTCEWRPEYACYATDATCEVQPNGSCGWTYGAGFSSCIDNAGAAPL